MRSVLIADDEPKIRRGLRYSLPWEEWGIHVVGEAENGEVALKKALELKPDILFVDINMPFLNGLQLIEQLNASLPDSLVIIITGYDEFQYAKEAIKLGVFAYLLKPLDHDEMRKTIHEALHHLERMKERNQYVNLARAYLDRKEIIDTFVKNWMSGKAPWDEVREYLDLLHIQWEGKILLLVIRNFDLTKDEDRHAVIDDPKLLSFSIRNMIEEILQVEQSSLVFETEEGYIVSIVVLRDPTHEITIEESVKEAISKYLHLEVEVYMKEIATSPDEIPSAYHQLVRSIEEKSNQNPTIRLAKGYIDRYYYKRELSLQEVADSLNLSPGHLSRLFHKEFGLTFKEYVNKVRIEKALKYMNDPTMKIYTIAERVGYSTQHYFSAAFKKMVGVSPYHYKSRKDEADERKNR